MRLLKYALITALAAIILIGGYYLVRVALRPARYLQFIEWYRNPEKHPEWKVAAGSVCDDAPFQFPTDGYIGFIWGDSFRPDHKHQGLDIFSGEESGQTPIYAAYDGYLIRKSDWISSVIIRVPDDPLNPGQQIWTYYTHMADREGNSYISEDFPPGTSEVFVNSGTLLGYMGNYSGKPGNPTGIHLHFSIVKDDGQGEFLNELEIKNTYDPSSYFNMDLNAKTNKDQVPLCDQPSG